MSVVSTPEALSALEAIGLHQHALDEAVAAIGAVPPQDRARLFALFCERCFALKASTVANCYWCERHAVILR